MEWTTERRYRLYQDWTQEEIQHIKENMAQHGILITMLSQKQDFSTTQMAFLTLMASGSSFTRIFLLVQPTV
ncbi:glycosyl hydrolases family 32 [Streptococcus pneumoniae]|nr:glycosyl hydrolases family 32 [Streptococcus pneumoniae]